MIRKWIYCLADAINENRRLRRRVVELLEANNTEVERRRAAENSLLAFLNQVRVVQIP